MTAAKLHNITEPDAIPLTEPVSQVLRRVADEAAVLAAELTELDLKIGQALGQADDIDPAGFQRVDAIRQEIEGLSQFLDSLSESVDSEAICNPGDAANGLKLRAQSQRLAPGLSVPPARQDSAGDLW